MTLKNSGPAAASLVGKQFQIFREFVDAETEKVTGRKQFGEVKQLAAEERNPVKSNSSGRGPFFVVFLERVAPRGKGRKGYLYADAY